MYTGFSSVSTNLDIEEIRHQLETQVFGVEEKLVYIPVVTSTNSFAMDLAHERPEEGVVVLTDSQTAGKGRSGRRWVDVAGCNVLSSTLLRPLFPPHLLVMIASLAVVDTIASTCGVFATIKWPNDVLIGTRKVAGILIETSHDRSGQLVAVLGIGVNVNGNIPGSSALVTGNSSAEDTPTTQGQQQLSIQTPLSATATTLEVECGHVVSRESFIAQMLLHLETDYLALQQEVATPFSNLGSPVSHSIWERWRGQLSTLSRPTQVRQGNTVISGMAEDVNENGELLLRLHSGELVNITWGDVGTPER